MKNVEMGPKNMISFTASGDALMVRAFPDSYTDRDEITAFIQRGDLRITNLETTITDLQCCGSAYSGGTWVTAGENVLDDLEKMGFNYYGISNNHTLDYSYEGLRQTTEALERHGLAYAGAGNSLTEAERACQVMTEKGTAAVISVCSTFQLAAKAGYATPELPGRPGLNYLRFQTVYEIHEKEMQVLKETEAAVYVNGLKNLHRQQGFELRLPEGIFEFGGNWFRQVPDDQPRRRTSEPNAKDVERICREIRKAKESCDAVIVQVHSHEVKGDNDEEADYFLEQFARACIDAGASAVVGGGTHQLKGIEIYKNAPIFYSLGNFVFQNALVAKLPADFLEKYGLPLDTTAPEAIRARSRTATRDLAASTPCFRSVIPYVETENGKCTCLLLKPIELGQKESGELRNLPHPADSETAGEILQYLKRVSQQYHTEFSMDGDLIRVCLPEE